MPTVLPSDEVESARAQLDSTVELIGLWLLGRGEPVVRLGASRELQGLGGCDQTPVPGSSDLDERGLPPNAQCPSPRPANFRVARCASAP